MIYVTVLLSVVVTVFLIGIAIQLIRMEKMLIDVSVHTEFHVAKIIRPQKKQDKKSGGGNSDNPYKALFGG